MGSDSLVSAGDLSWRSTTKVHRFGSALLGIVGDCNVELALVGVMRSTLTDPTPEAVGSLVLDVAGEHTDEVDLLMGCRGELWGFVGGHLAYRIDEPYHAVGAAQAVALGAMWPVPDSDPGGRVRTALDACSHHCRSSVAAPFFIESI